MVRIGDKIGPYTLRDKLGRGGFGEVWLADNPTDILFQQVAVKLPHDEDVDIDTIQREAKLWREITGHPNIVPFIEAKIYEGQIVIVSEYAEGGSLSGWLKRSGGKAPSQKAAIQMLSSILDGLAHLHSRRIVHRDLKPANILLQQGIPRLADFGISKLIDASTQNIHQPGTLAYMPPEAFENKRSIKTDIWAVGIIFYLMLTGQLPFDFQDDASLIMAILLKDPNPLPKEIPILFHEFISRSLQKQPENRFQSVFEMRESLEKLIASSSEKTTDLTASLIFVENTSNGEEITPVANLEKTLFESYKNEIGMNFILISPGKFLMGMSETGNVIDKIDKTIRNQWGVDEDEDIPFPQYVIKNFLHELPQQLVQIPYWFYLGVFPVTQGEWKAIMNNNPSFIINDSLPVDGISWFDAKEFVRRLNERNDGYIYRLPSEVEWEYACRAGTMTEFAFGDNLSTDEANFNGESLLEENPQNIYRKGTTPIGSFKPNAWGLFDMHGNVWEWCEDIFSENYKNLLNNSLPNLTNGDQNLRILRGGSWGVNAFSCRSAYRGRAKPETIRNCNGFRIVAIPK